MGKTVEPTSEPLTGIEGLADYLTRPVSWCHDNWKVLGIPAYRVGRRVMFRISEVDAWLEGRREGNTHQAASR